MELAVRLQLTFRVHLESVTLSLVLRGFFSFRVWGQDFDLAFGLSLSGYFLSLVP